MNMMYIWSWSCWYWQVLFSSCKSCTVFKKGHIDKIILSRPAVEAGENLGFLPGDMKDKVDPYLRPIYDALYEMMPFETVEKKYKKE